MPSTIDYAFAILTAIVFPIWGFFGFRRLKRQIAAGDIEARALAYLQIIVSQWTLAAGAVLIWLYHRRPWAQLGLAPTQDWRLWTGLALTLVAAILLVVQWRAVVTATGEKAEVQNSRLRSQLESVKEILPQNRRELRRFFLLALTAGTCEELLYRAYLIWFLAAFTGMGILVAAALSTLIFAAAHLYQGPGAAVKVVFVGAAMAGLYLFSRSIWLPMLLHALLDVTSGAIAFHVLSRRPADPVAAACPATADAG